VPGPVERERVVRGVAALERDLTAEPRSVHADGHPVVALHVLEERVGLEQLGREDVTPRDGAPLRAVERDRGDCSDEQDHAERAPHGRSLADLCYTRRVSDDRKQPKLRKATFATDAEIPIKGAYGPDDARAEAPAPGQFPFTRGVQPTMYRGQFWTMRQYAGFGTATESNKRYKYLLAQGGKGLSVAFDLPTQMGRDSDHAMARGEVGRVGVAIDSLEDMRILFDGIPPAEVSTSMTINATAATPLAPYIPVGGGPGPPGRPARWSVENDTC